MSTTFEKTVKIVDPKGKVLAELSKVLKDVTVEEFKKMLVRASPFRKYLPIDFNMCSCFLMFINTKRLEMWLSARCSDKALCFKFFLSTLVDVS